VSFAVALVILLVAPAWVMAQTPDWESLMSAAQRAEEGGRLGDAEQLYAAAIAKTQGFDEKDRRIEQSLTALGDLHGAQGRYADAARFYDRALTALEKALPAGDPGLVPGLNRLGTMWRLQGRAPDAEPLHRQALASAEKTIGADEPADAACMTTLETIFLHKWLDRSRPREHQH